MWSYIYLSFLSMITRRRFTLIISHLCVYIPIITYMLVDFLDDQCQQSRTHGIYEFAFNLVLVVIGTVVANILARNELNNRIRALESELIDKYYSPIV